MLKYDFYKDIYFPLHVTIVVFLDLDRHSRGQNSSADYFDNVENAIINMPSDGKSGIGHRMAQLRMF